MSVPPRTYDQLRDQLQERLAKLAPGQSRIARVLLSDPDGTAFRTIGEMARAARVHESSVVRFATGFGLDGYPGLVELCRQQLADQAQMVRRFESAQQHAAVDDLVSGAVRADGHNLTRTFARIDRSSWDQAVELLAEAPAVHVIGLRQCYAVAYLLSYLLHLVRRNVHEVTISAGLLVDQLRDMSEGDVFVAISIHRYTAEALRALTYARRRGLKTIVITDNPASPLAPHGDLVFYVDTSGVGLLRSMTALTCVVQALVTATALRLGPQGRANLALEEQILEEFRLYANGPELELTDSRSLQRDGDENAP